MTFYGPEEALIAYNEGKVDIHAIVNVVVKDLDKDGKIVDVMMKETSVGRVIVNEIVPAEVGYLNTIISKSLCEISLVMLSKLSVLHVLVNSWMVLRT